MSLTDEDKEWFRSILSQVVKAELRVEIRAEIKDLKAEIKDVKAEMIALEDRLVEKLRDVESSVLRQFHKWASPTDQRIRTHSEQIPTLDLAYEQLSDRVTGLENPPSQ